MLVDDNELLLSSIKRFLAKEFTHIMDARTGEEAIALFERQPYEVVVIDINLPGIDGWEVFKYIKQQAPQTRVIIITSREDEELKSKALSEGAAGFFTKPFSLEELKGVLEKELYR